MKKIIMNINILKSGKTVKRNFLEWKIKGESCKIENFEQRKPEMGRNNEI